MLTLDGVGISDGTLGNAVMDAKTDNIDKMMSLFPHSEITASGTEVGLRENQAGDEKVGYMTLSSGEIIKQRSSFVSDFADIDSLATNQVLKDAIEHVKKKRSRLHIMGLMSDGGINSNIDDIINMINYLKTQEISICIDFIADGKDVDSKSALKYIERIEETEVPIVSICGRYYAMAEEDKWDRTRVYYDLVRNGVGLKIKEVPLALKNCYMRNITDEYLPPLLVKPDHNIKDNDVVFWVNYKDDGCKSILLSIVNPEKITEFQPRPIKNIKLVTLYPVDNEISSTSLIQEEGDMSSSLGVYLSKLGFTQARIAARNTYEYITYYFNGEKNIKIPKCTNYLIDMPESIPGKLIEINAAGVAKQIIKSMEKDTDFILASFGAIEEVALTGDYRKTVKMLEFIDECLGRILESAELNFYTVIITSPYASIESMINDENRISTAHTTNKVPLIITDDSISLDDGSLADIAPTILSYMDVSIPESMQKSRILIKK